MPQHSPSATVFPWNGLLPSWLARCSQWRRFQDDCPEQSSHRRWCSSRSACWWDPRCLARSTSRARVREVEVGGFFIDPYASRTGTGTGSCRTLALRDARASARRMPPTTPMPTRDDARCPARACSSEPRTPRQPRRPLPLVGVRAGQADWRHPRGPETSAKRLSRLPGGPRRLRGRRGVLLARRARSCRPRRIGSSRRVAASRAPSLPGATS